MESQNSYSKTNDNSRNKINYNNLLSFYKPNLVNKECESNIDIFESFECLKNQRKKRKLELDKEINFLKKMRRDLKNKYIQYEKTCEDLKITYNTFLRSSTISDSERKILMDRKMNLKVNRLSYKYQVVNRMREYTINKNMLDKEKFSLYK